MPCRKYNELTIITEPYHKIPLQFIQNPTEIKDKDLANTKITTAAYFISYIIYIHKQANALSKAIH